MDDELASPGADAVLDGSQGPEDQQTASVVDADATLDELLGHLRVLYESQEGDDDGTGLTYDKRCVLHFASLSSIPFTCVQSGIY